MNDDTIRIVPQENGWLVSAGDTPIGYVQDQGRVVTPSGAEYGVREGRGAARLWSHEGKPVANYDREPNLHVKDVANGVLWELKPEWLTAAASGGADGGKLDLDAAWAVPYTLEDAHSTVPARVKLLLAYMVVKHWLR